MKKTTAEQIKHIKANLMIQNININEFIDEELHAKESDFEGISRLRNIQKHIIKSMQYIDKMVYTGEIIDAIEDKEVL